MCSNCGECCSNLLHLSDEEIERIKKYIKDNDIQATEKRIIPNGKPTLDLGCPFRNNKLKLCKIYEVRPDICRLFKCDTPPDKERFIRDIHNMNKQVYSLREVFYEDYQNQQMLYNLGIKVGGKTNEKIFK